MGGLTKQSFYSRQVNGSGTAGTFNLPLVSGVKKFELAANLNFFANGIVDIGTRVYNSNFNSLIGARSDFNGAAISSVLSGALGEIPAAPAGVIGQSGYLHITGQQDFVSNASYVITGEYFNSTTNVQSKFTGYCDNSIFAAGPTPLFLRLTGFPGSGAGGGFNGTLLQWV